MIAAAQYRRKVDKSLASLASQVGLAEGRVHAMQGFKGNSWSNTIQNAVYPGTGGYAADAANQLALRVLYDSEGAMTTLSASVCLTALNSSLVAYIDLYQAWNGQGPPIRAASISAMQIDNRPVTMSGTDCRMDVSATFALSLPPGRYDAYLRTRIDNLSSIPPTADTTVTVHNASLLIEDI